MKRFVITALTVVATVALPVATLVVSQTAAAQQLDVRVRPPEPRVEVRGEAPHPGYVWGAGSWNWDNHARRHTWVGGSWMAPRGGGQSWHQPEWQAHNRGWRFHRGHWGR